MSGTMDFDDIANVLYFLRNIEPLQGCDYNDDDQMLSGRARIHQWLEQSTRAIGAETTETIERLGNSLNGHGKSTGPQDIDKPTGFIGTSAGNAIDRALNEQRETLRLAQSIVDSVEGSLRDKLGTDWPEHLPYWPMALSGVSKMLGASAAALDSTVVENRGKALVHTDIAEKGAS